jgi:C-terminal peptidase prc
LLTLFGILSTAAASSDDQSPNPEQPVSIGEKTHREIDSVAQRLWAITEIVGKESLQPRSRSDMLLAALKALPMEPARRPALERRVEKISSQAQLAELLVSCWPAEQTVGAQNLGEVLVSALLQKVPGDPKLIPTDIARVIEEATANRYVGLGIQVAIAKKEARPQITNPFKHGVAYKAGVRPGDLLLRVGDKDTKGVPLSKIVDWLRGAEGSHVAITVQTRGAQSPRTYQLTRSVVPFESILGFRRAGDDGWNYRIDSANTIAYVRLNAIRASTLQELRQLEHRIEAEGCRSLVLDFRFSSGEEGLHNAALLADGLLDEALMWRTYDRVGKVTEYRSDRECLFRGWPLVILVERTLSDRAQAVLVAALQDNNRAVIVGEPTKACDGYVTTLFPLPTCNASLPLRTGRLERAAKDRSWPVQPDHLVTLTDPQRIQIYEWQRQKELPDLRSGQELPPPDDPQLAKAVTLLKSASAAADARGKQ